MYKRIRDLWKLAPVTQCFKIKKINKRQAQDHRKQWKYVLQNILQARLYNKSFWVYGRDKATLQCLISIYVSAFGRCFYPKQLTGRQIG